MSPHRSNRQAGRPAPAVGVGTADAWYMVGIINILEHRTMSKQQTQIIRQLAAAAFAAGAYAESRLLMDEGTL